MQKIALVFLLFSINTVIAASFQHRKPKSNAAIYYLKNNSQIKRESDLKKHAGKLHGSTWKKSGGKYEWDLKGGILDGRDQKGDGGQSEKQEPLMRIKMPLIIKNGFIRNNKDGINFKVPGSGLRKITWLNVGEDAVNTSRGAYDFVIEDCEAINSSSGDKSFQFNEAKGLVAKNNVIMRGTTGMRIGDSKTTSVKETAYVGNNRFIDVDTAYHPSKITVQELSHSYYENVRHQWVFANGAKRKKATEDQPPPPPPSNDEDEQDLRFYKASAKGGTRKGKQSSACKRAKERALEAAKKLCNGEIKSSSTEDCDCVYKGNKSYTCESEARVGCLETNSPPTRPTLPQEEQGPTPDPDPKDQIIEIVGKGGTTKGDQVKACSRAISRAKKAASERCATKDTKWLKASECSCVHQEKKKYNCETRIQLVCDKKE